jgi:hypothetical protein
MAGDSTCSPTRGFHRAQVGAFERMNITLASLLLIAQTLKIKVGDLFKGLED